MEKLATKQIVKIEDKQRNYRTMAGSYKNKKKRRRLQVPDCSSAMPCSVAADPPPSSPPVAPVGSTVASLHVLVLLHCHGPVLLPALSLGCHGSGLAAALCRVRFPLKQGQDVGCQQLVSLRTRVDRIWAPERQQMIPVLRPQTTASIRVCHEDSCIEAGRCSKMVEVAEVLDLTFQCRKVLCHFLHKAGVLAILHVPGQHAAAGR